MKLLWLVNITLPAVTNALHLAPHNTGGWLSGQLAQLDKNALDITVVSLSYEIQQRADVTVDGVHYVVAPVCDEAGEQALFTQLLAELMPDLVHIHGTELSHSYSMLSVVGDTPCVISMQGLVYVCAQHYFANLPERYHKARFAKRLLRLITKTQGELVAEAQQWFVHLGEREKKVLREGKYFIGRTTWDEHHLKAINPNAAYHKCNEILRPEFYGAPMWDYASCKPHSIFISQGNYPLKGFHILLEAVALVKQHYPDVQVYTTGTKPLSNLTTTKDKLFAPLLQEYPAYLAARIKTLGLERQVNFLGNLSALEMRAQYLTANVYVLASSMENSPNSLAEAMMLGTPCVASNIGGVPDMMENQTEGLLYPFGNVELLAKQIELIFAAKDDAAQYGKRAAAHANETHNPIATTEALMGIYAQVKENHGKI